MQRLTFKDGRRRNTILINGQEHHGPIADRLAAYENTGLTPEELDDFARQACKIRMAAGCATLDDCEKVVEEGRLLVLPPLEEETLYPGLKRKYIVAKADTGKLVEDCFVLRPDRDPAAQIALEAYAKATENNALAADIANWCGDSGKVLVLPCKLGTPIFRLSPDICVRRNEDRCDSYCDGYDYSCYSFASTLKIEKGHFCLEDFTVFGEIVFLTREEAETALEARKGEHNV